MVHWLRAFPVLQRNQVGFPAPMWQLTVVCKSISRESNSLFLPPWILHACGALIYLRNTPKIKLKTFLKRIHIFSLTYNNMNEAYVLCLQNNNNCISVSSFLEHVWWRKRTSSFLSYPLTTYLLFCTLCLTHTYRQTHQT